VQARPRPTSSLLLPLRNYKPHVPLQPQSFQATTHISFRILRSYQSPSISGAVQALSCLDPMEYGKVKSAVLYKPPFPRSTESWLVQWILHNIDIRIDRFGYTRLPLLEVSFFSHTDPPQNLGIQYPRRSVTLHCVELHRDRQQCTYRFQTFCRILG